MDAKSFVATSTHPGSSREQDRQSRRPLEEPEALRKGRGHALLATFLTNIRRRNGPCFSHGVNLTQK